MIKLLKKALIFFILLVSCYPVFSQNQSDEFQKYNTKRIHPGITYWNEIHFSTNLAVDNNYKDEDYGNLMGGINYGFGIGHMFKIGLDDLPQSIGIGLKAEYFPSRHHKYNVMFDLKIIAIGDQTKYASFLGGGELNMTYSHDFSQKEMHMLIYMFDVQYDNFELKWGLQSWYDGIMPLSFIDQTFNVFKFTYKLILR